MLHNTFWPLRSQWSVQAFGVITFWSATFKGILPIGNQFTGNLELKIQSRLTQGTCFWAFLLITGFTTPLSSFLSPAVFWMAQINSSKVHVCPCRQTAVPSWRCMWCCGHQRIFHRPREAVIFTVYKIWLWCDQTGKSGSTVHILFYTLFFFLLISYCWHF